MGNNTKPQPGGDARTVTGTQSIESRLARIEQLLLSQKTVFNFDEVVTYTGYSKSHLYKLTSSGGIPCYRPGGKQIFFRKSEIDEWLLSNRKLTFEEIDSSAESYVGLCKRGGEDGRGDR